MSDADTLYGLMSTQRAVRRLRPDPVPDALVERIIQAACWAPTGGNGQQWRVVVIRSPETKAALAEIYAPAWHAYAEGYAAKLDRIDDPARRDSARRTLEAGTYLADHFADTPVLLAFLADTARMTITDAHTDGVSIVGGGSVYPAIQNALLAARAEGLGCVLTTLHCAYGPQVLDLLGAQGERGWALAGIVPLGWPVATGHGPISRRPPTDMAYADTLDQPWRPTS